MIAFCGFLAAYLFLPLQLPIPVWMLFIGVITSALHWRKYRDENRGDRYVVATFFFIGWMMLQMLPADIFKNAGTAFAKGFGGFAWVWVHLAAVPFVIFATMPTLVILRNRNNGWSFFKNLMLVGNKEKAPSKKQTKIEYIDFYLGVDAEFPLTEVKKSKH